MAAYAQFGYSGYPSATQLLSANGSQSPPSIDPTSTQTAVSLLNVPPPISPSADCRTNIGEGTLTPDVHSQNSNSAVEMSVAKGIGTSSDGAISSIENVPFSQVPPSESSCCANGRPIIHDPVSGQTVCSCQYDSARLAFSSYSRLPAASVGVYGTPYPPTDQNPYQSIGVDSSAFYSPLSNPYALKDTGPATDMTAWTSAGLQPTTSYYSYDPMSAYGYGASYDLAARRKNATRESTATLKAWLNEHKKNPYPTKGEKIMLAIITKMTLTQVSTWFANARRRLKKENKMTWEPKNRTDDDDDAILSDDEKDKDEVENNKSAVAQSGALHIGGEHVNSGSMPNDLQKGKPENDLARDEEKAANIQTNVSNSLGFPGNNYNTNPHPHGHYSYHQQHPLHYQQTPFVASFNSEDTKVIKTDQNSSKNQLSRDCGVPIPATKPKIWSLADTVACKTPQPSAYMGQQLQFHQQQQQQQQLQQQQQQHQIMQLQQQKNFSRSNMQPIEMHQTERCTELENAMISYNEEACTRPAVFKDFQGHTIRQLPTTTNIISNNTQFSTNNNNTKDRNENLTQMSSIPTQVNITSQMRPQSILHQTQQQQLVNQYKGVGFPEAQPDTPPQTPPNMKVPIVAVNMLLTTSQSPTAATCHSNKSFTYENASNGESCPMNFSTRFTQYSPKSENSGYSSCGSPIELQRLKSISESPASFNNNFRVAA